MPSEAQTKKTRQRLGPSIRDAITEEMRRDDRVVVWGEDVAASVMGTTAGLFDEFGPDRVVNTPISEAAFLGAALGAAMNGLRPVVDMMYASFTYVAFDQLVNQIARVRYMTNGQASAPLVVLAGGGAAGFAAQHSELVYPLLMHAGGLRVVFPSTPHQAFWLTRAAIRSEDPVVVLYQPALAGSRGEVGADELQLGHVDVTSFGRDATVFAIGLMAVRARNVARRLSQDGIGVEVVDVCTLAPLPVSEIVAAARRTGRIVVADEARRSCSAASEIGATIAEHAFSDLKAPVIRVAVPDVPIPFNASLERHVVPDEDRIESAIREVLA